MSIAETEEIKPGAFFTARDGNYNILTDACFPAPDEPTDFVYDADGNELRAGDFALVLKMNFFDFGGKIVRITSVRRADLYPGSGAVSRVLEATIDGVRVRAWSPTSGVNGAQVALGTTSSGTEPRNLRKVNLTPDDTLRCELSEMYEERSRIDHRAAEIEAQRVTLNVRIREHRQALGEID